MHRRDFLRSAGAVAAGLALPRGLRAQQAPAGDWRTFQVVTRVEVLEPSGVTRVWVPTALATETPYQRTLGNEFAAEGGTARLVAPAGADALGMVAAEFPAGVKPVVVVTSRVSTRNYAVDFAGPGAARRVDRASLAHFLRPTRLLPTDGIVRETARQATRSARTDLDKARALRLDRGEHVPRPQGPRLRHRRHQGHARDAEPGR
jgi:transglutaminase-like putative cysteine protease